MSLDELKILPKSASDHNIFDQYSIEKLLGKKKSGEDWYYLVQFAGYEPEWTLASDITPKLRQAFDVEQTAILRKQKRGEKKARLEASSQGAASSVIPDRIDLGSRPLASSVVIPRKRSRGRPRKSKL